MTSSSSTDPHSFFFADFGSNTASSLPHNHLNEASPLHSLDVPSDAVLNSFVSSTLLPLPHESLDGWYGNFSNPLNGSTDCLNNTSLNQLADPIATTITTTANNNNNNNTEQEGLSHLNAQPLVTDDGQSCTDLLRTTIRCTPYPFFPSPPSSVSSTSNSPHSLVSSTTTTIYYPDRVLADDACSHLDLELLRTHHSESLPRKDTPFLFSRPTLSNHTPPSIFLPHRPPPPPPSKSAFSLCPPPQPNPNRPHSPICTMHCESNIAETSYENISLLDLEPTPRTGTQEPCSSTPPFHNPHSPWPAAPSPFESSTDASLNLISNDTLLDPDMAMQTYSFDATLPPSPFSSAPLPFPPLLLFPPSIQASPSPGDLQANPFLCSNVATRPPSLPPPPPPMPPPFPPLSLAPLDPGLAAAAKRELGESPSRVSLALASLRDALSSSAVDPDTYDDSVLLSYLRPSKFRIQRARDKVVSHAAFVRKLVDDGVLMDPDPHAMPKEPLKRLIESGCFYNPQLPLGNGCRLCCIDYSRLQSLPNALKNDPFLLLRWQVFCLEHVRHDPYLQVHGLVILQDFGRLTFRDVLTARGVITPKAIARGAMFARKCVPFRLRAVVYLDVPSWFDLLWSAMKPFLSEKVKRRVVFVRRRRRRDDGGGGAGEGAKGRGGVEGGVDGGTNGEGGKNGGRMTEEDAWRSRGGQIERQRLLNLTTAGAEAKTVMGGQGRECGPYLHPHSASSLPKTKTSSHTPPHLLDNPNSSSNSNSNSDSDSDSEDERRYGYLGFSGNPGRPKKEKEEGWLHPGCKEGRGERDMSYKVKKKGNVALMEEDIKSAMKSISHGFANIFKPSSKPEAAWADLDEILNLDLIPEDFGGRRKISEEERREEMLAWLDQMISDSEKRGRKV